ncbi:hypothetical protein JYU15_02440, partial [bacterium AH-315-I18]|nr:hypothetical protein [bacterium AH-315-I18]
YDSFGFDRIIKLQPRKYQLVVEVLSYGKNGPLNEIHGQGGLVVQGAVVDEQNNELLPVSTGNDAPGGDAWRVIEDAGFGVQLGGGITGDTDKPFNFFWALAHTEAVDLNKFSDDPLALPLADERWVKPAVVGNVLRMSDPPVNFQAPWILIPSAVPQPELTQQVFHHIVRCTDNTVKQEWDDLIFECKPVTIAANTAVRVIVDHGKLTTAYPQISFAEGKNATVRLVYAESFSKDWQKGVRDQAQDMFIEGHSDVVTAAGNNAFYSPMRWQTFRYIELYIQTHDQPLTIKQFDSLFHAYPLKRQAEFTSDNELANSIWDMSWHTLRLCCQDHFTDCPYYEQLQYVGDALIQALVAFNVGGDTKLWRRLLTDMDHSRLPMGLTQSRYPSHHPQIIPTFSLIWIRAVQQYDQHVGESELVGELYGGMGQVINWFMQRYNEQGLFASMQWWQFVDWIPHWHMGCGSHSIQREGDPTVYPSSIVNFQLLDALDAMVKMGPAANARLDEIAHYQQSADALRKAIRETMWSEDRGLFADSPNLDQFSEHANLLAVMTRTASKPQTQQITENLFNQTDEKFARCTMYFQFYFAQVMSQLGLVDHVWERLDQWESFLDLNLTTLPERPDHPDMIARSDCHAWSAWPAHWFVSTVLGVHPATRAYGVIGIKPNLGRQQQAHGTVPTPHGPVIIKLAQGKGQFTLTANTPAGVPCVITMPNGQMTDHHGGDITLQCEAL